MASRDGTGEDVRASLTQETTQKHEEAEMAGDDQQHYPRATAPPPGQPRHRSGAAGLLRQPVFLAVLAAAAVGLLVGTALGVFGGTDGANTSGVPPTGGPTVAPSETSSAEPPSPTATVTVPAEDGSPTAVTEPTVLPVYYVGRDPQPGDRRYLYREFRRVQTEGGSDPAAAAVQAMLTLPPLDPDYLSVWPAGATVTGLTRSGDTAVITFSDEVARHRADPDTAAIAAQHLVYTVTAADRSVHSVRLVIDGQESTTLFGQPIGAQPLTRAAEAEVVAPVWIIDPYEGAQVGRSFAVYGTANVFEATVSYLVRDGTTVVDQGTVQASSGTGLRGEWTVRLTLPAGRYVIEAFESSAENGEPLFVDSKTVTIG